MMLPSPFLSPALFSLEMVFSGIDDRDDDDDDVDDE